MLGSNIQEVTHTLCFILTKISKNILLQTLSYSFIYSENVTSLSELAAFLDEEPAHLIGEQFNISYSKKSSAGNLLTEIYTNTTFQGNIGASLRVRKILMLVHY